MEYTKEPIFVAKSDNSGGTNFNAINALSMMSNINGTLIPLFKDLNIPVSDNFKSYLDLSRKDVEAMGLVEMMKQLDPSLPEYKRIIKADEYKVSIAAYFVEHGFVTVENKIYDESVYGFIAFDSANEKFTFDIHGYLDTFDIVASAEEEKEVALALQNIVDALNCLKWSCYVQPRNFISLGADGWHINEVIRESDWKGLLNNHK